MDEENATQAKAGNKVRSWVALAVVVAAFGVTITSRFDGDVEAEGPTGSGAIDICRQAVEAQLKAPGSAEFGGELATEETGRRYQVDGYVDAANSYGTMLRLEWTCEAVWSLDGFWDPVTAKVTG